VSEELEALGRRAVLLTFPSWKIDEDDRIKILIEPTDPFTLTVEVQRGWHTCEDECSAHMTKHFVGTAARIFWRQIKQALPDEIKELKS